MQDRYKRLQDTFDKQDTVHSLLAGAGGSQMSEVDNLLMSSREARDDLDAHRRGKGATEAMRGGEGERWGRTCGCGHESGCRG